MVFSKQLNSSWSECFSTKLCITSVNMLIDFYNWKLALVSKAIVLPACAADLLKSLMLCFCKAFKESGNVEWEILLIIIIFILWPYAQL